MSSNFLAVAAWFCLTHAVLCLGSWSLMGLVRDDDVNAVAIMDEVEGQIELNRLADILKLRLSTM